MDLSFSGFSDMGITNSGAFTSDSLSFAELEKALTALVDERHPKLESEAPFSCGDSFKSAIVENKVRYFLQLYTKIMETKKNFIIIYNSLNNKIDDMIQEIVVYSQTRKKQLKSELDFLANQKLIKWDRQLFVCTEALKELQRTEESTSTETTNLSYLFNVLYAKELEFVDTGEVRLEVNKFQDIITYLQGLGTIMCYRDPTKTDCSPCDLRGITPKFVFGSSGGNPGQFCRPWGVCSDPTGRILVADRSNNRIQIFNECGQFLMQFGKAGSEAGEFNRPSGIDVDRKFRIIVADKDNHRIQLFTYSGKFLFEFGGMGSLPGQFKYPWDVAVNKNCEIAVSDSKNNRVQLFSENGIFITLFDGRKFGIRDPRAMIRFLDSPRGVAFAPDGTLLVTDFNNHRVLFVNKVFDGFTVFGKEGSAQGQFFRPQGISCDRNGKFAVADSKNYRIQVFDNQKRLIKSFGSQGVAPGQFDCPQGINFHINQNIIVVDFKNNRVQIF